MRVYNVVQYARNAQIMDNQETSWVIVLGVTSSIIGVIEFLRRIILYHENLTSEYHEIIKILEEMQVIQLELEDVMKHPSDSEFGVRPVISEIENLSKKVNRLQKLIEQTAEISRHAK